MKLLKQYFPVLVFILHLMFAAFAVRLIDWLPIVGFVSFTLSFGFLLLVSVCFKFSYVLKFFNTFFYLGFYLKLCFHLIFSYPFNEPIGTFIGTSSEMSEFFIVSSAAACAVALVAIIDYKFFFKKLNSTNIILIPGFLKYHKMLFYFITMCCVVVAVINLKLGINISGLAAVTILPRPFNALIGFFLSTGFAIVVAVYAASEFAITKKLKYTFFLVLIEGAFSTVSVVSRGVFLFHFIPFFMCVYILRNEILQQWRYIAVLTLSGMSIFVFSGFLVTKARSSLYDSYNLNHNDYMSKKIFDFSSNPIVSKTVDENSDINSNDDPRFSKLDNRYLVFGKNYKNKDKKNICGDLQFCNHVLSFVKQISGLVIDRWIGAEGLMAVISYPEKGMDLIYGSLVRIPKVGEQDIFEKMNKSFYPISNKYVFTSLPGPVAFFYYSGKTMTVFFGLFLFILLMLGLQYLSQFILNNDFLKLQTSFFFAIGFMQFGISPRPLLISFIMMFSLLVVIRIFITGISSIKNKKLVAT